MKAWPDNSDHRPDLESFVHGEIATYTPSEWSVQFQPGVPMAVVFLSARIPKLGHPVASVKTLSTGKNLQISYHSLRKVKS